MGETMMTQVHIPIDGEEDIIIEVDYGDRGVADLVKLDADLKLISEGALNIALPPDTDDFDEWTSLKGKAIGKLCNYVDSLTSEQHERMMTDNQYLDQIITEAV